MAWFRRGKKSEQDPQQAQDTTDVTPVDADVEVEASPSAPAIGTERGPWDSGSIDGDDGYLKLGAIWVPAFEGLMLTFEMDQAQSQVTAVQVVRGDSTVQLQAFAAPRTSGLWGEIRREIAEGIEAQGASAVEEDGEYGTELVVQVNGGVMRFVGVDGPRWFLRGVITGRAAVDAEAAAPLREVLANVVVDRGTEPMGPRELLPLALPTDGTEDVEPEPEGRRASDLDPFTRGPEIMEIN